MKKSLKIIALVLMIFCIITLVNNSFGFNLDTYKPTKLTIEDDSPYYTIGGTLISIIRTIGIIVCVGALVIVGITMMYGSIEQKAEYKKKLLPIVIGAFFVVGTTSVLKILNRNVDDEYLKKYSQEQTKEIMRNMNFELYKLETDNYLDEFIKKMEEEKEKYSGQTKENIDNTIEILQEIRENYLDGYVATTIKEGHDEPSVITFLEYELEEFYREEDVFIAISELEKIQENLDEYILYYSLCDVGLIPYKMNGMIYNSRTLFKSRIDRLCEIRNSNPEFRLTREDLEAIDRDFNELKRLSEIFYNEEQKIDSQKEENWWAYLYVHGMYNFIQDKIDDISIIL